MVKSVRNIIIIERVRITGDAHLKRQLLGQQVTMAVKNGSLDLGTWEQIHYAEFDGQRDKRILVKVMGILGD